MNQIRKTKIQNIGRASRALLWLMTPCTVFVYFMIIFLVLFFCFAPSGDISSTDLIIAMIEEEKPLHFIENKGLLISTRAIGIAISLYLFIPSIFLLKHLKQVLQSFYKGDIFNATALIHARKAYAINLFLVFSAIIFDLLCVCLTMYTRNQFEVNDISNWASASANGLIEVAISTLLIWAFELGTDVNAEAELTI